MAESVMKQYSWGIWQYTALSFESKSPFEHCTWRNRLIEAMVRRESPKSGALTETLQIPKGPEGLEGQ